jgi:hypothetical protein
VGQSESDDAADAAIGPGHDRGLAAEGMFG